MSIIVRLVLVLFEYLLCYFLLLFFFSSGRFDCHSSSNLCSTHWVESNDSRHKHAHADCFLWLDSFHQWCCRFYRRQIFLRFVIYYGQMEQICICLLKTNWSGKVQISNDWNNYGEKSFTIARSKSMIALSLCLFCWQKTRCFFLSDFCYETDWIK